MNLHPGPHLAPLVLRVALGSLFIAHLTWKFVVLPGGLSQWWSNFAANGYPSFVPYYVFSSEIAGALLLVPGIYVRWVSLYALPMMLGAAHFWWTRNGFYFTASGAELPLVWSFMLVLQVMLGDGPYRLAASRRASP